MRPPLTYSFKSLSRFYYLLPSLQYHQPYQHQATHLVSAQRQFFSWNQNEDNNNNNNKNKNNNMGGEWRCSGGSNEELIGNLFKSGIIKSEHIRDAMVQVCKLFKLQFKFQME